MSQPIDIAVEVEGEVDDMTGWTTVMSKRAKKKKAAVESTEEVDPSIFKTEQTHGNNGNNGNNPFQDWKPVQIEHKRPAKTFVRPPQHKPTYTNYVNNKMKKIENETDIVVPITVEQSLSEKITKARQALNLTRKELGAKLSISEGVIADIENGSANYDPVLCTKIKKFLNVQH